MLQDRSKFSNFRTENFEFRISYLQRYRFALEEMEYSHSPVISIYKFEGRPEMLSNFRNDRPEMLKFSDANTTMILSVFYVFIQWLRRVSISLFFDRPEMLSRFEKGRPEMLVTGDAYHWGMTVLACESKLLQTL